MTVRPQTLDKETVLIDYASYPELVSRWLSMILLGLLFRKVAIDVAKPLLIVGERKESSLHLKHRIPRQQRRADDACIRAKFCRDYAATVEGRRHRRFLN